jgi:diguanylate cyclase (GGDEF)-like protein
VEINSKLAEASAWAKSTAREYGRVQGEATMETLRRFRWIALFVVALHVALAIWFSMYAAPADRPEMKAWSQSLVYAQVTAALMVIVLATAAHFLLQRNTRATYTAIALQVLMSASYMVIGLWLTVIDLKAGAGSGTASFMLISILIGVVSLMRPGISIPLFALSYLVFLQLMSGAGINSTHVPGLMIVGFAAPLLAAFASIMIWHQYAKNVVLRRQLSRTNGILLERHKEMEYQAEHDALTGLYNRREFMRLAEMELERAIKMASHTCVIMVDVDFFKKINDNYGHPTGDEVLLKLSGILKAGVRTNDVVARMGGEEFIILLSNTPPQGAVALAEKLRKILDSNPMKVDDLSIPMTASFGVSGYAEKQQGPIEALYAAADKALYTAKNSGRNRVEYSAPIVSATTSS